LAFLGIYLFLTDDGLLFSGALFLNGGPFWAFSRSGVGAGPLAMYRQGPSMPEASVTPQVHQPFDVHGNFCSKFPLYLEFTIDYLADVVYFSFGKIVCTGIGIDFQLTEDPIGNGSSDTIDIGQSDFYPFTSR
jgi:hypothetical protein